MFNNFGVVGTNGSAEKNTNTRIRTFYSDLSCFQMSYWNENISIKLNPFTGVNAEGVRQYDFGRKCTTALTPDKSLALVDGVEKVLFPVHDEYEKSAKFSGPVSVSVAMQAKNSIISIEYKEDPTNNNLPTFFLVIYTNIGEDGKAPKDGTFAYKFAKIPMTVDYNAEEGTAKETKLVDSEFLFFLDKLKTVPMIAGTAAHSVNSENTWKSNRSSNNNGGGFAANNSGSFNLNNPSQNSYTAPVSDFSGDEFNFVSGS